MPKLPKIEDRFCILSLNTYTFIHYIYTVKCFLYFQQHRNFSENFKALITLGRYSVQELIPSIYFLIYNFMYLLKEGELLLVTEGFL